MATFTQHDAYLWHYLYVDFFNAWRSPGADYPELPPPREGTSLLIVNPHVDARQILYQLCWRFGVTTDPGLRIADFYLPHRAGFGDTYHAWIDVSPGALGESSTPPPDEASGWPTLGLTLPEVLLWYWGSVYIEHYHHMRANRDTPLGRIIARRPPRLFSAPLVSRDRLADGRYAAVDRDPAAEDERFPHAPYRLCAWAPGRPGVFPVML